MDSHGELWHCVQVSASLKTRQSCMQKSGCSKCALSTTGSQASSVGGLWHCMVHDRKIIIQSCVQRWVLSKDAFPPRTAKHASVAPMLVCLRKLQPLSRLDLSHFMVMMWEQVLQHVACHTSCAIWRACAGLMHECKQMPDSGLNTISKDQSRGYLSKRPGKCWTLWSGS